jgi:poly(3-hydroxybutyrate) depolymerase
VKSKSVCLRGLLIGLLALPVALGAEEARVELRYDLRPGDHFIYREVFDRQGKNSYYKYDFQLRKQWTTHMLVVGREGRAFNIGFQRNREQAEMLRFRPDGKDKLEEERPRFAERVAQQSPHFAEANQMDAVGWPRLPWAAVRESWSEVLFDVHELAPLPRESVRPGDSWRAASVLGLEFRASGWDLLDDQSCLRIDGSANNGELTSRFWFCPESQTMRRLEFNATYPVFGGRFQEKVTLELIDHRRDEPLPAWLADPDLQQGALAALTLAESIPVKPELIHSLSESADTDVQRKALALIYRHRLQPPPVDQLEKLLSSENSRVRALAVRAMENVSKAEARPAIEQAREDADYLVREAALGWLRDRLPVTNAPALKTPVDTRKIWDQLADLPLESPSAPALTEVSAGKELPVGSCGQMDDWMARAIRSRRLPPEPSGASARGMTTPGLGGWPYVIYIPEDYRSDQPFPLLIYLSGDSGRAIHGVGYVRESLPDFGYLVLFPQASGYWWHEDPTARSTALLHEVLQKFNVDTNRVYLAGTSNGGTGMIRYAAWWNDRLAAATSLMGAGLYSADDSEPPLIVNLLDLPFLFLHGEDDKTIPLQTARDTYKAMRRLDPNAPVTLLVFKDRGHDVLLDTDEGQTLEFFQQHTRDPFPSEVVFQATDMRFPRRFWLEILEKKKGPAEVRGRIDTDNTVRVDAHGVKRVRLLLRPELLARPGRVRVVLNGKKVFDGKLTHDCGLLQESWRQSADPFLAYSAELVFDVP